MGLVNVEFEFGKSKFDKVLIYIIRYIYWLYLVFIKNWKNEGFKKEPELLKFPLVHYTFIYAFIVSTIGYAIFVSYVSEKYYWVSEILLLIVLLISFLFLMFVLIFIFVYLFYICSKLVRILVKTIKYVLYSK